MKHMETKKNNKWQEISEMVLFDWYDNGYNKCPWSQQDKKNGEWVSPHIELIMNIDIIHTHTNNHREYLYIYVNSRKSEYHPKVCSIVHTHTLFHLTQIIQSKLNVHLSVIFMRIRNHIVMFVAIWRFRLLSMFISNV